MSSLKILLGGESFRELREQHCCYVDKTSFLEEMLGAVPPKVSMITRPRRFGKTLTMSMLHEFFNIRQDGRELFAGLAISRRKELCETWMNQYPTIFLTLKGVEGRDFAHALEKFALLLAQVCSEHTYLFTRSQLNAETLENLLLLKKGQANIAKLENALFMLCRALEDYWRKPVILLIDEYDVPINYAEQNGYYGEMIGFMRNMLGTALKTNASLKFAVLTGCLRIARESVFTGLNNFMCYSVSDADYADKFGFTDAEVDALLAAAELGEKKGEFREWYDGYRFGDGTAMYCPWDILAHIARLQKNPQAAPQAYWSNTSGNAVVRTLVSRAGQDTRDKIGALLSGGAVEERISEELTYDVVYNNERNIWSLLYLTGYLTRAPRQSDKDKTDGKTALVIPNKEIRMIFADTVSLWFEDSLDKEALSPFVRALWDGDADTVRETLTRVLYGTISYHDGAENYYHGFMAGLLRGAGLPPSSNREQGLGRADIVVEDGCRRRALILELKRAREYAHLDAKAEEGLRQIAERNYAAGLPPQIQTVMMYGIAFWRKECAVKVRQAG